MSYGGYQQYGGNPYGGENDGYGSANPYGSDGGYNSTSNPYGSQAGYAAAAPAQQTSSHAQPSQPSQPLESESQQLPSQPLSQNDFLDHIRTYKLQVDDLANRVGAIAVLHQQLISSPDSASQDRLAAQIEDVQALNRNITTNIKFLERDLSRDQGNSLKQSQFRSLKQQFRDQLQAFQRQESEYERRYRDAIARQYRIVNPDATEEEVQEAANANWGNEGVFQSALKSNRSGQASSVLGAVRARHNDIVQIEKALGELALLFQQLDEAVTYQDTAVQQVEQQTEQIKGDTEQANQQLTKATVSARRARKLKWWCLFIVVLILAIIALVLGIYFGVVKK